ncbi:3-hydroxyacyl-ACP dehydratase [Kaistella sp. PBT33-4]|uniref:3-hydroxyacyl-ACP dehydratase n=1 Tax=Kaistella sp. PBT33-4 TaxID=3032000 RepID=UPI0023D7FDA2|nr:3-hydroxyacyl-ACP dehydratase [Kaistella sp. PBT33-4]MDF0718977.1 3-hydroxyacyl-ACP dehydratase [Kaistella sp. PBT33-4]
MDILNGFYILNSCENTGEGTYSAMITLDPAHQIFSGHFPGNPVAPGVCMMQIVKDVTERILERKLFLTSANNVKFMAIINPDATPVLKLDLDIKSDGEQVKVKNVTSFGETIALKMSVNYKFI